MSNTANGSHAGVSTPLRRTRTVMSECSNNEDKVDFLRPTKRCRPCVTDPAGCSISKLSFICKPSASGSAEPHVDKNDIFAKVQDVPLFRGNSVKSVSSDVSMGAEEMDVDI
jgi:hypothetical protein